jgi:hypothetical protein
MTIGPARLGRQTSAERRLVGRRFGFASALAARPA